MPSCTYSCACACMFVSVSVSMITKNNPCFNLKCEYTVLYYNSSDEFHYWHCAIKYKDFFCITGHNALTKRLQITKMVTVTTEQTFDHCYTTH